MLCEPFPRGKCGFFFPAYMLGLSCSSGNGTKTKMLMPCSTNRGPWDKIWKFLWSLKAPINIIIITAAAATVTFACQRTACKKALRNGIGSLTPVNNENDLRSYVRRSKACVRAKHLTGCSPASTSEGEEEWPRAAAWSPRFQYWNPSCQLPKECEWLHSQTASLLVVRKAGSNCC